VVLDFSWQKLTLPSSHARVMMAGDFNDPTLDTSQGIPTHIHNLILATVLGDTQNVIAASSSILKSDLIFNR
jgi:hypothetical protein